MGQLLLFIGPAEAGSIEALATFKSTGSGHTARSPWCRLCVLRRPNDSVLAYGFDAQAGRFVAWSGSWFHRDAAGGTADELLALLRGRTLDTLARELEGFFAVIVGDENERTIRIVTDRCGSSHVFSYSTPTGFIVSTSSATIAAIAPGRLDPVGVNEFLCTGNIYGDRTLWEGVRKIPPASISTFGSDKRTAQTRYWSFADLRPGRLALNEAVDEVGSALIGVASSIGKRFRRAVCDVTGGYDSRACLAGLLAAGLTVDTTVSGPDDSGDVRVSREIASLLGLRHIAITDPVKPTVDDLIAATRLTDGESDAFGYARVRSTHLRLAVDHDVSINGSFGELARGYWWELLLPGIGRRTRIDAKRIVAARFAADAGRYSSPAPLAEADLLVRLEALAADSVAGITQFPNTTQLDCVYFTLRMQRWQGRIASATDQIWPCLSPFAFPTVLVPILEARTPARMGSRLIRTMIDRVNPELAAVNLEHGYPAQPLRISNLFRFCPLLTHLARDAVGKVQGVLANRMSSIRLANMGMGRRASTVHHSGVIDPQLIEWLSNPLLAQTGLFDGRRLVESLLRPTDEEASTAPQWTRLVTLELLLRELQRVRATPPSETPRFAADSNII